MSTHILGIDEVGRGALAGPVYLGACRLPSTYPRLLYHLDPSTWQNKHSSLQIVRDSKKLPPTRRKVVARTVHELNLEYRLYSASAGLIDEYGIGTCLSHLVYFLVNSYAPSEVIIDGQIKILSEYNSDLVEHLRSENNFSAPLRKQPVLASPGANEVEVRREKKADDKYLAVALASNLAKVERDRVMTKLAQKYPVYDWGTNKGYGTAKHRTTIKNNFKNPYLRQSFLGKIKAASSKDTDGKT